MIAYLASSLSICATADVSIHHLPSTECDTPMKFPACETAFAHQTASLRRDDIGMPQGWQRSVVLCGFVRSVRSPTENFPFVFYRHKRYNAGMFRTTGSAFKWGPRRRLAVQILFNWGM